MTYTNFNEFKKFWDNIPKERIPFVRCIPIRQNKKVPECQGTWKRINMNYYQVKNRMNCGGNIGIVAIPKGIMIIDLDTNDKKELLSLDMADELDCINTLTIKTRSNGLHFYFLNDSNYNTQNLKIDEKDVGELRANWSYVLSAGSWVNLNDNNEGGYKVINEKPIKPFPKELEKYFVKGISEEKNEMIKGKTGRPLSEKTIKIMKDYYKKMEADK